MATLKQIRDTAESVGVALNTKTINFIHKHQDIQPSDLTAAYFEWFSVELEEQTRQDLESVLSSLIPDWGKQLEEHVDLPAEEGSSNQKPDEDVSEDEDIVAPQENSTDPDDASEEELTKTDQEAEPSESEDSDPADEVAPEAQDANTIEDSSPDVAIAEEVPAKPVEPFRPWWDESTSAEETEHESPDVLKTQRPDVSTFLNVARRPETDRFEYISVSRNGADLELSWPAGEGSPTYVVCGEDDHYPFEVTVENALAILVEVSFIALLVVKLW